MAKKDTIELRKFKRLCQALEMHVPHVLGHLECLWRDAYIHCDPRFDVVDVECAALWQGEQGRFLSALCEHGWLDRIDDATVEVHDFWDHAPTYLRGGWFKRHGTKPWEGSHLKGGPLEPQRSEPEAPSSRTSEVGASRGGVAHSLVLHSPVQHSTEQVAASEAASRAGVPEASTFDEFWAAYPASAKARGGGGRDEALRVWTAMDLDHVRADVLKWLEHAKGLKAWTEQGGRYVPNPAKWLRGAPWASGSGPPNTRDVYAPGLSDRIRHASEKGANP